MRGNRSIPGATVVPVLVCPDVRQAVAWPTAAFGFTERSGSSTFSQTVDDVAPEDWSGETVGP